VLTCASGTLAVEVALRAVGVGPGDLVVQAAYDYPPNFLSLHELGAKPLLVDVCAANWNMDVSQLPAALEQKPKAVLVSHLHGGLVAMREVMELCRAKGVAVIEDAAQAIGATVQGRLAGTWGDVGVFSFGGSKLLSAGRGGALVTSRADLHQRARLKLIRGDNLLAPMTELQAVVLIPQLDRLAERHALRAQAVTSLTKMLEAVPGITPFTNRVDGLPAYYKVGLQFDERAYGVMREVLVKAMAQEGIALKAGFRALHVGRSATRWRALGPLPEAERAHAGCLVLHHPVLLAGDEALAHIVETLQRLRAG
jgi:dTDP-4-amino-4,6-dideoxygalactose transaminase